MKVDYGSPIQIYVQYSYDDYEFMIQFNGEDKTPYEVPDARDNDDLVFVKAEVTGDVIVNFIGFGPMGKLPLQYQHIIIQIINYYCVM